jgi:hypothetical protein
MREMNRQLFEVNMLGGKTEAEIVWDQYVFLLNAADAGGPPVTAEIHNDFALRLWRSTRKPTKGKQTLAGQMEAEKFRKGLNELMKLEGEKNE